MSHIDPDERMPPSGAPLSPREIETLRTWIEQGATYDPHWTMVPPRRVDPPVVQKTDWPRTPIDRFVLAPLERRSIEPSPEADRITLIRRLSFDLRGLPPTPAEVDAFVADASSLAYERLVDQFLASPQYGERMAVHWLDLVRYADTVGYHSDVNREISAYRDWVIDAFNANLPFDQFTREQLAGDLLPSASIEQRVASAYNMLGMTTEEGGAQPEEYLKKYAADRVRNASAVWMGATLGCAECHDHKFDPYTSRDFYRFAAFFADIQQVGRGTPQPTLAVLTRDEKDRIAAVEAEIASLSSTATSEGSPSGAGRAEPATARIDALNEAKSAILKTARKTITTVTGTPRVTRVLPRGDWLDRSGEIVEPGVPESFRQIESPVEPPPRATRLDLADWLLSPDQPQTARVFVNRLWSLYFGIGISKVLDDLGSQGEWPTHPALLDWLAVEFRKSGWDIRHMVRLMVLSSTYRQTSLPRRELEEIDPENRLLARQARFRVDAEFVRDSALAISGLLSRPIGGETARPYQPAGYYRYLNFPKRTYEASTDESQYRRGVYTHWQRTFLHPFLLAFDAPSREECVAQRPRSNTALAALALLNDPTFVEAARVFAERIVREGGVSSAERLAWGWREVTSRGPSPRELEVVAELHSKQKASFADRPDEARALLSTGLAPRDSTLDLAEHAAWTAVARALFNLSEAITRY